MARTPRAPVTRLLGLRGTGDDVGTLLRLLPRVWPAGTALLGGIVLVRATLTAAAMPVMGALLAGAVTLPQAGFDSPSGRRVLYAFAAFVAIRVLQQFVLAASTILTGALGRRLTRYTTREVLAASLRPTGVRHLEDPAFADRLSLAQGVGMGAYPPGMAVSALAQVVTARLSGLAAAIMLVQVVWWAPLPLLLAWRITGRWLDGQMRGTVERLQGDTPVLRRAGYLRELGLDGAAAKEVRIFGLGGWLVERFTATWTEGMRELLQARHGGWSAAGRATLLTGTYLAVFGTVSFEAAQGSLGIAQLTVAVQAAFGMASLGWIGDAEWQLTGASSALPHVLSVRDRSVPAAGEAGTAAGGLPARAIAFENVTFGYPGRAAPALDRLDLRIPAGRSLALVGANGAGKTTLVKLLARCYDADTGRVTVDGIDLRELDPASWRRRLAVVFQDFMRFELSAQDNVAFGGVEHPADAGRLAEAARLAGVGEIVATLPDGWGTMMSRRYPGGADLSGGQWQRLALARAMYAVESGAKVLILDEPSAHLDVRAEAALYERLLEITSGLTTVLISHRFSTVRTAQHICVLRHGRIAEYGSHEELLDKNGDYARMFRLQAERFAGDRHA